jgi:hypothetical protein
MKDVRKVGKVEMLLLSAPPDLSVLKAMPLHPLVFG